MSLHLDSTDKKILRYLLRDARMKITDIATSVGMTSAAIHQRMTKIKKGGVIDGYSIQLNERKLGYHTCAFVGIILDQNCLYHEVAAELDTIDQVVEAHCTTGAYGIFIKLRARSNEHLMEILSGPIQNIKGVLRTETFISLDESIQRPIPI